MPTHDIIDNRREKLVDHINRILPSTDKAKFAVGYFFLSGLTSIAEKLKDVKELRLLIGNTTNRETLEQIAEGYKRLDLVANAAEGQAYPKKSELKRSLGETAQNLKEAVEVMDPTDEGESLIKTVAQMIEEKRVKVRVYTKGRLHAKAYIFDYREDGRYEKGIAIVGSSNLTLSGVSHNTELNVVVQGNENHAQLATWFDELWDEAQDFDEALMREIRQSWAMALPTPYDIYMKTLYSLVKERLDESEGQEILWDDEIVSKLADFQKAAVRQVVQIIKDYGGGFVADVVGLGKSYIGTAIIKHFERTEHARALIICPPPLIDMWERYNEVYQLNARVVSSGFLRETDEGSLNFLLSDVRYKDRDFILVDESHNFRHPDTQRYRVLQSFLSTGRKSVFLTATPRNKSAWDIYHQTKLFHSEDKTDLPVDPPDLKQYFKAVEKGQKNLRDLLSHILIRRTRNHVLRWYGYDSQTHTPVDPSRFQEYLDGKKRAYVIVGGRHQFFPKRELETIQYSIEATYQGLYQQLRGFLGRPRGARPAQAKTDELTYARYGLWHYVQPERQKEEPYTSLQRAGSNLRGLVRVLLFKRFESSVHAFRETLKRLVRIHEMFLASLQEGFVPAGEEAQNLLYESDQMEETELIEALRRISGRYPITDFSVDRLKEHIKHDIHIFKRMIGLVEPITPAKDAKLHTLNSWISKKPLSVGKKLIFTQYADTARYLFENLNPGGKRDDIDVIFSGDKSKTRVVGRFAPKANPEYHRPTGEAELQTVIATDVLAEGLNLQDCDKVVNYDLHWNPVRLIQRFGRIDRIGSDHDIIYGFNFLPELELDRQLGLHQVLANRIQEIHDTIGEDSKILDKTEQLNEEAMYAIYEKKGQLHLFEEEKDDLIDLNEAEEILRQIKQDNPAEFERVSNLRDGIRTGRSSETKGTYIFCKAGRYQKLYFLDPAGEIVSQDISQILSSLKCSADLRGRPLLQGHNQVLMKTLKAFREEVQHRQTERDYTVSLTHGQKYVLRELRSLFGVVKDEDVRGHIALLEKAFRGPLTGAIKRELNLIRRNGITGEALLKTLKNTYDQHNMRNWIDRMDLGSVDIEIPRIVCSEAFNQ
jgi:HKD family nuclease/superfamily II DNA or RNA helicase